MDYSQPLGPRVGLSGNRIPVERDISHPSRPTLGPTQPPVERVTGLFSGVKAARTLYCTPAPSSAEGKEIIELYLHSPSVFHGRL
jgi:hypothetical protein